MNPINAIEHVAEDVVKGIEYPFSHLAQAIKVISTAIKDQPEIKNAVVILIEKCDAIGVDAMKDIGEKGLNLSDDLDTARKIADLGDYLKTSFFPLVVKVFGEIKADVTTSPSE